jgi:hypothetical protein
MKCKAKQNGNDRKQVYELFIMTFEEHEVLGFSGT